MSKGKREESSLGELGIMNLSCPIPLRDVDLSERIGGLFFSNNAIELAARIQWEPVLHALLFFHLFLPFFIINCLVRGSRCFCLRKEEGEGREKGKEKKKKRKKEKSPIFILPFIIHLHLVPA